MSSCDLCHWQQRTACSHVQTQLAPRDSAPQAVNCSSGRLHCFHEKFSGWHKEKVFASLQTGGIVVCAECLGHILYTAVQALKSTRQHATWTLEIAKQKVNDALRKTDRNYLGSVAVNLSGGSLVSFQRFWCWNLLMVFQKLNLLAPWLIQHLYTFFLQYIFSLLLYFSVCSPCKPYMDACMLLSQHIISP